MRITQKFIADLKTNPKNTIEKLTIEDLAYVVRKANEAYHSKAGPFMTDDTFDSVKEHLAKLDKSNKAVSDVGALPVVGKKVALPYYMGSMDKIKTEDRALESFQRKYTGSYVIADKLDGISALLHVKNDKITMYTRGDGTTGQDITHLIKSIVSSIPTSQHMLKLAASQPNKELTVRGELIITKADFETVKTRGANARNMVAGIVNAKKPDAAIAKLVKFVAYTLIAPSEHQPSDAYKLLSAHGFNCVYHEVVPSSISFDTLSEILLARRDHSAFEVDGLVVSHNAPYPVEAGKNPSHTFAFKNIITQETVEVVVTNVEWNASKDGYLVPVVEFDAVQISGVMVKRASGFNGKYIQSNIIGPGARILVTRSGLVIPYILKVITPAVEAQMPKESFLWTETGTDIYLQDIGANKQVQKKELENFFTKLSIPGMKAGTVAKLFEAGLDSLDKIITAPVSKVSAIDGFQAKSAEKIVEAIKTKLASLGCVELMDASNAFGRGFGSKRLSAILTALPKISDDKSMPTVSELVQIDGVSDKTADAFLKGLPLYREFKKKLHIKCDEPKAKRQKVVSPTRAAKERFVNQVVVFTGFRDATLKEIIEAEGGEVGDSVTKRTTVLVAKDLAKATGKVEKAKQNNVIVYSLEEFKTKYLI